MRTKTEQLACFVQAFTMALELIHRCRFWNNNGGTVGENVQIKGR